MNRRPQSVGTERRSWCVECSGPSALCRASSGGFSSEGVAQQDVEGSVLIRLGCVKVWV